MASRCRENSTRLTTWLLFLWAAPMMIGLSSARDTHHDTQPHSCGLYYAKSTIPNAGFGVFAGRSYEQGHIVVEGDIAIPLEEMDWHNDNEQDYAFAWDEYSWAGSDTPEMSQEVDSNDIELLIPGMGAVVNHLFPLDNVHHTWTSVDNGGLHRKKHHGVGAFTPYHNRQMVATTSIAQGNELFIDYGAGYFQARTETYGHLPVGAADFERADAIVKQFFSEFAEKRNVVDGELNDAWNAFIQNLSSTQDHKAWKRAINALPQDSADLSFVREHGTGRLHHKRSIRSLEWLEENGKCADNIRVGPSTIPQAGRGAFAKRFIPKGGLVAPAPLIHIPDGHRLNKYASSDYDVVIHSQLLLNYCFSHKDSTMLLSPYGIATSLINHSSKEPNARIVWSDIQSHPEWMNMSVSELNQHHHAGLAFDFIALRDIDKGEEILMDYGKEWETAWESHVNKWKSPADATRYQAAYELNNDEFYETLWNYDEYPYYSPSSLLYILDPYFEYSGVDATRRERLEKDPLARIVGRYTRTNASESDDDNMLYTAEIVTRDEKDLDGEGHYCCVERMIDVVFGLPRDALWFEDEPYTRDHQLDSSFRHAIMVLDDVFPQAWKNKL